MTDLELIDTLNELLVLEFRSLAMYLADAAPWTTSGSQAATEVVNNIQQDRLEYARRMATMIQDLNGAVDAGDYPMEFTDTHDLALDFLIGELQKEQAEIIAEAEAMVVKLADEPAARALAEEVLGSERAHQEALDRLAVQPSTI